MGPQTLDTTVRQYGTIRTLNPDKGWGFIRADDGGIEYFFHKSAAPDFAALERGSAVRFLATTGHKGPRAEAVELV